MSLASCGGNESPGQAAQAQTSSAVPITTIAETTPSTTTISPASPRPPRAPTKVLGEPLVYRLDGAAKPTPENDTPPLRYVLIFRLNWNPHFGKGVPLGPSGTRMGNIRLAGLDFFDTAEQAIFDLDPVEHFDPSTGSGTLNESRDDCFIGEVRNDPSRTSRVAVLKRLNAIPLGGPVEVRLRLLTPKPNGKPRFADALELQLPLRSMRVRPVGPLRLNRVASRQARDELQHLGCAARILDFAQLPN